MSNGLSAKKKMFVGKRHAGEKWTDVLEGCTTNNTTSQPTITIDSKGYGTFPVLEMSVSVWVNARADGRERFDRHL
jgi:alpha-amylase